MQGLSQQNSLKILSQKTLAKKTPLSQANVTARVPLTKPECHSHGAQGAARRCFDILVVVVGHASVIAPSQVDRLQHIEQVQRYYQGYTRLAE